MEPFLATLVIIGGPIPIVIDALAVTAAIVLAVRLAPRRARLRWWLSVAGVALGGAGVGLTVCWLVGDVADIFGVTLSAITRAWVAVSFAGVGLALLNLVRSRPWRKATAFVAIVVFVVLGAIGVNADFGQYPTVASALGMSSIPQLDARIAAIQRAAAGSSTGAETPLWKTWTAPTDLPAQGIVAAVTIPATASHFTARQALIYLPPAAMVAHPPALPVLVMLSGQPGSPDDVFAAGHLDQLIDRIAAHHGGLAPIVVVPDQLGAPHANPMCVDSALGNSATYLTVDVPAWIRTNLDIQTAPDTWGIAGFSQGGTCAIQLGAGHPDIFGSIVDISGELEPKSGSPEATVAAGFAGNTSAYDAAKPLALLASHAPYSNTVGIFAAGGLDTRFTPWIGTIAAAANAAGMRTTLISSPGTAHDWQTVQYAIDKAMPVIYAQMGLGKPAA